MSVLQSLKYRLAAVPVMHRGTYRQGCCLCSFITAKIITVMPHTTVQYKKRNLRNLLDSHDCSALLFERIVCTCLRGRQGLSATPLMPIKLVARSSVRILDN